MNILHIQFKLFFHFAFLALLWFFWTVLTPVSPATFLCPLPQFSLCSHIFFQNNFGADVSETIFNPLIQRPMCVQTISCTKRIRASFNFLFGVFTLLLSYMYYSSYFFRWRSTSLDKNSPSFYEIWWVLLLVTNQLRLNWTEAVHTVDILYDTPEGARGK